MRGSLCALSRDEIISTAQTYANDLWTCNTWNIEPSAGDENIDRRNNWPFSAGNTYTGIPYAYGSKDSISTFHANIAISATGFNYIAGKADDKIEESYDVTIKGYAGLDCSGLVSYAYNRTGAAMWGTQTLPASFVQIEDPHAIEKGDVLSWITYHCMLFDSGNVDGTINTYHAVTGAFGSSKRVQRAIYDNNIQSRVHGGLVILKCQSNASSERPFKAFTASPVFLNNVYPSQQITIDPNNPKIIPIGIYIASKKGITDIRNVEGSINGVPGTIAFKRLTDDNETVLVTYTPTAEFHQGTYNFNITATNDVGFSKSTYYTFDVVEGQPDDDKTDEDQDSMSDQWEKDNFGDTSHPWNGDYDGDGYTNLDEFRMGTDPADPNSPAKKGDKKNADYRDPEYNTRGGPQKTATKGQNIIVAQDPNSMDGPSGSISPGQSLTYTVSFENIGAGIAYGVYITDQFDPGIDDASVQVSNCRRVDYAGGVETPAPFAHTYDPQTRLLSVFVDNEGEVGSKQGGKFDVTVRAKSSPAEGSIISNYATVFFPSVPEETPTNTIVSVVPKRTEVLYTGKTVVEYSDTLEITTVLSDANDTAIQSQPVIFIINTASCTQTTADNGSTYAPFDTRDILPGDYTVQTVYPGDGCYYLPSQSASTLKVLKKRCLMTRPDCTVTVSSSATVTVGVSDTYHRELLHQDDEPKTVYLEYRDSDTWKPLAQTTVSASSATFAFSFPEQPHHLVYALRARFEGDARYEKIASMGQMRIVDDVPPEIAISSPIAGWQYGAASRHIPIQFSVSDNLDPSPTTVAVLVNLEQGTSIQVYTDQVIDSIAIDTGTWIMTVQATDWAGNISTAALSAFEVVHATNPPVLTVPADITVEATGLETTVVLGTATATSALPVAITNDAPALFKMGVTTVTWTAADSLNAATIAIQRVTVVDTTPPQITIQLPEGDSRYTAGISTVTVSFTVRDADPQPAVQALLINSVGAESVAVSNGQVIHLQSMAAGLWALNVTAHDWAGNAGTGTSGLFEIVYDTPPVISTGTAKPTVIETYPAPGGYLNLKRHDAVVIRFSTPVICADWNSYVAITETKDRPQKDFAIVYDTATNTLIVAGTYKNNSLYTITLKPGITDAERNTMDEYSFSFTVLMNSKKGGTIEDIATGLTLTVLPDALPCDGTFELALIHGVSLPKLPKPYAWHNNGEHVYQILFRDTEGRLMESPLRHPLKARFPVARRNASAEQSAPLHEERPLSMSTMKIYQVGTTQDAVQRSQPRAGGLTMDDAPVSDIFLRPSLLLGQSSDEMQRELTAEISSFGLFSAAGFSAPGLSLEDLSCYPSPFKPPHQRITIQYYLADAGAVSIAVYDLLGNLVKTWHLPSGSMGARSGINQFSWDGRNGQGDVVASGGYIVLVSADNRSKRFKLLVIK